MATKKNQVATKPESAVGMVKPDFMKKSKRGIETLNSDDFAVPSLYMLQKLNPEVEKGHQAGKLYHNILEETVEDEEGSNQLLFIPITVRIQYKLWNPRHLGGGALAFAEDGVNWDNAGQSFDIKLTKKDPYVEKWVLGQRVADKTMKNGTLSVGEFGSSDLRDNNSVPAATKCYTVLAMAFNRIDIGPFILRYQKTSEGVGKRMNQRIRTAGVDSFGQVFALGTEFVDKGDDEQYYRYTTQGAGFVQDPDLFAALEKVYEDYSALESWNIKEADPVDGSGAIEGEASEVTSDEL